MNDNKYTKKYMAKRKAEGWIRRSILGPADIVEDIIKEFKIRMIQRKLKEYKSFALKFDLETLENKTKKEQ